MPDFAYVYILESQAIAGGFYAGLTDDLATRLAKHNAGEVPHTAKTRPWHIKTAVAFRNRTEPLLLSAASSLPRDAHSPRNARNLSLFDCRA